MADIIDDDYKNDNYGFLCLHHIVKESIGVVEVEVLNKNKSAGNVFVITVDGGAHSGKDFKSVDTFLHFDYGEYSKSIEIEIL